MVLKFVSVTWSEDWTFCSKLGKLGRQSNISFWKTLIACFLDDPVWNNMYSMDIASVAHSKVDQTDRPESMDLFHGNRVRPFSLNDFILHIELNTKLDPVRSV